MGYGLIIGIIIGIFFATASLPKMKENKAALAGIMIVLIIVVLIIASVRIVQPGEVGIQILLGSLKPNVLQSGIHFVNPLVHVQRMTTRLQAYTMSIATEEGERRGSDPIDALTKDGMTIKLDLTVWYKLDSAKAVTVFRDIGVDYVEKIVRPAIRTAIRDIAVNYSATDVYSSKRGQVTTNIQDVLKNRLDPKGIVMDQVLLRNVELPPKVKAAIDDKISAEQDAQKMEFVLQKAQKQAEVKVVEAGGIAKAQAIINQTLTTNYLQHEAIEAYTQLAGSPNTTFVILPTSTQGSGMPLIINTEKKQ